MNLIKESDVASLVLSTLRYHWRSNIAILFGVAIATAVLAGALVVGDSVRESLRTMSLERLGAVDHVVHSSRFVREDLARAIAALPQFGSRFDTIAPGLILEGSVVFDISESRSTRASKVNVIGVDSSSENPALQRDGVWDLLANDTAPPTGKDVFLSNTVARQLGVQVGDDITLWLEMPNTIPRDTLLGGSADTDLRELRLSVSKILPDESGIARFALNPSQQLPLNLFASIDTLQEVLGLGYRAATRRNPRGALARVNALFVSAKDQSDRFGADAVAAANDLVGLLQKVLDLSDLHLRLEPKSGYLALESAQMILERPLADTAIGVSKELGVEHSPVFIYLANELANASNPAAFSTYSIIAGVDPSHSSAPFGPWKTTDGGQISSIEPDGILINEWLSQDLELGHGERLQIKYHEVGAHGILPDKELQFTVNGIVPIAGPSGDRGMTPAVEGITDVRSMRGWKQPFPMDMNRVTQRDDDYWEEYRATPKAFVNLDTAQQLWKSRYGDLTSLRIAPRGSESLEQLSGEFRKAFLGELELNRLGLVFQPVKHQGVTAASGTTDFSGLFIGFSFFLILAATLLVALLFRLGIERRLPQIGLFSAVGFTPAMIRSMLLLEGLAILVLGGVAGVVIAIAYAEAMIYGLKTWWSGAIGTQFLFVHLRPVSLFFGLVGTILVALLAMLWAIPGSKAISARDLLAGIDPRSRPTATTSRWNWFAFLISAAVAIVFIVASLAGLVPSSEAFAGLGWQVVGFFAAGISGLVASWFGLAAQLSSERRLAIRGRGIVGLSRLGFRDAARNRRRSVMSASLVSTAVFVIVAVAAGHRNPATEEPVKDSGNGGFSLVAETRQGIVPDLNSAAGRSELDINLQADPEIERLFEATRFFPFRVKPGENASCLNIYQTQLPTLLGASDQFIQRGGFRFVSGKSENPWELLKQKQPDGSIPVIGDMNTLMYSLHKGVGDKIPLSRTEEDTTQLKIVGMLDSSVFQGVLVMAAENFEELFTDRIGFEYFLLESEGLTAQQRGELVVALETSLAEYGFDSERVSDRIASFLAVQNTYLTTFQSLGGFGLLLGTLGLGTVMLRNVVERRSELALFRALGFGNRDVVYLVMWEHAILLTWGVFSGTFAALLAMTPHLQSTGADVPWASLAGLMGIVVVIGMTASYAAVFEAVRTPIVATLRGE